MPDTPTADARLVLEAASFAARAHRHQVRKDGETPYVAHPFRVCLVVRHVFGIDDPDVLIAALLHDTIEDTTTDFDDLARRFGPQIASWVAALSKDTRLPEADREAAYVGALAAAPPTVKVAKLGDIFDNLSDCQRLSPGHRLRTAERSQRYLAVLQQDAPELLREPLALVWRLLEEVAAGELNRNP
jgi:guanosine-3',5'-bis(diphosphate) 3'-pyrophosphohydrolase